MTVPSDKYNLNSFYINGNWQKAKMARNAIDIVNPASDSIIGSLALGSSEDVDSCCNGS